MNQLACGLLWEDRALSLGLNLGRMQLAFSSSGGLWVSSNKFGCYFLVISLVLGGTRRSFSVCICRHLLIAKQCSKH